jgi:hypothetical protein
MKKGIRRMEGTAAALMLAGGMAASNAGAEAGAKMDFSGVAARLEPVIREEMREWNIKGITVALVHNQTTVHLEGFGEADRNSIFRVGSISKLGTLYATTENMVDYRLTPINRHVFRLPPGMYVDEAIVFLTDGEGNVHGMDYANMPFPRRGPGRERSQ